MSIEVMRKIIVSFIIYRIDNITIESACKLLTVLEIQLAFVIQIVIINITKF